MQHQRVRQALTTGSLFRCIYRMATGCLLPFLPIYFRQMGLSAALVGFILAARGLAFLTIAPLARRYTRRLLTARLALIIALLGLMAAYLGLMFAPFQPLDECFRGWALVHPKSNSEMSCGESFVLQGEKPKMIRPTTTNNLCNNRSKDERKTAVFSTNDSSRGNASSTWEWLTGFVPEMFERGDEYQVFITALLSMIAAGAFSAVVEGVSRDALLRFVLRLNEVAGTTEPSHFDAGRLWGYVGFAFGGLGITAIVTNLDCNIAPNISRMTVHMYTFSAIIVLVILLGLKYPIISSKLVMNIGGHLRFDACVVSYSVVMFLSGFASVSAELFLFWLLQDLDGTLLLLGIVVFLSAVCKLAFLVFARSCRTFARLSKNVLILLALCCISIQLFLYSLLTEAWLVLPAQVLSFLGVPVLRMVVSGGAGLPNAELMARDGAFASIYNLGAVAGSLVAGLVASAYNFKLLFRCFSIVMATCVPLFGLLQFWGYHRRQKLHFGHLLSGQDTDFDSETDDDVGKELLKENYVPPD